MASTEGLFIVHEKDFLPADRLAERYANFAIRNLDDDGSASGECRKALAAGQPPQWRAAAKRVRRF
jgi:hypothetical protein